MIFALTIAPSGGTGITDTAFHQRNDGADLKPDPGGNPVGRRWTLKDSLAVIPVKGKALKFVAWIDHPDSDAKPVHVKVWADSGSSSKAISNVRR